jgi:hypothetical protein
MFKRNVPFLLLFVLFMVVAGTTQFCSKDDPIRIRVKFQKEAGVSRTVGDKKIPQYRFNPGNSILSQLKDEGIEIVGTGSSMYDFDLIIHHQERGKQVKTSSGKKMWLIFVNQVGFVLKDKAGNVIVEKKEGPVYQRKDLQEVVESLAGNITEHIYKHQEKSGVR